MNFAIHGRTVLYRDGTNAAAEVTAIVGEETAMDAQDMLSAGERQTRLRQRPLSVRTSEAPSPARGQTFEFDGQEWTVRKVDSVGNGQADLIVTRPERVAAEGRRLIDAR